jgi:hypothetical protein
MARHLCLPTNDVGLREKSTIGATAASCVRAAIGEWARFRRKHADAILQMYWWQLMGVYILGSSQGDGTLKRIGQFFELGVAIAAAIATK